MANGTHVICSNTSSLPEVVNNAALQINPSNDEEILEAIMTMINLDEKHSMIYCEREYQNLKRFSWDKTVHDIISLFESVL